MPPPGVRQSVGTGGVNDQGDLLQARRNLARLGYAPRIRGIGEPDGGIAAVQNGLRAYQQAKGIKIDGRMNPGGKTERTLHRQIAVQQKRLIEQFAKDAGQAAADLSAGGWSGNAGAIGGPESVAARTLGARMTGAKVEAQQRETYAEALDRMKPAGAQATKGGTGAKRLQGVAGHPLARAAAARNARAERRKQAGLGDIEHAAQRASATQEFAPDAARLNDPAGRREAVRRGFGLARKRGVLPDQLAGWLQRQLREPGADFAPNDPHGRRLHYTAGPAVEAAREVNRLRRDRPGLWAGLPAAVRRKAAAIGAAQAGMETSGAGADGDGGGRERAILLRADALLRSVAAQENRETAARIARNGFDLLTDIAPVVGDIKAAAEARELLRQAEAAERSGHADRAAELRALAGLSLASIIPLARAARAGKKLIDRIAGLSRKLKGGADPVVDAIDARAAAANRKGGRPDAQEEPKEEELPENFERGPKRAVGEKWAARRKLAILEHYGKNPTKKQSLKLDDIFPNGMAGLDKTQRKIANIIVQGAQGKVGERMSDRWLRDAGFATATEKSGRTVRIEDTGDRRYDIATTDKFVSFLGLFVFPGKYRGKIVNNRTVQIEVKSGGGELTPQQSAIDNEVKTAARLGNPKQVVGRKDLVVADIRYLQVPTHRIDKHEFAADLTGPLKKHFGKRKTEEFLKDLDDFYSRSTDENPITFGIVVLCLVAGLHSSGGEE